MIQVNLFLKEKQVLRYGEQTCGCQGERWDGETWIGSFALADASHFIYIMDNQQGPTV